MDAEVGRDPQYDVFADEFLDHVFRDALVGHVGVALGGHDW